MIFKKMPFILRWQEVPLPNTSQGFCQLGSSAWGGPWWHRAGMYLWMTQIPKSIMGNWGGFFLGSNLLILLRRWDSLGFKHGHVRGWRTNLTVLLKRKANDVLVNYRISWETAKLCDFSVLIWEELALVMLWFYSGSLIWRMLKWGLK